MHFNIYIQLYKARELRLINDSDLFVCCEWAQVCTFVRVCVCECVHVNRWCDAWTVALLCYYVTELALIIFRGLCRREMFAREMFTTCRYNNNHQQLLLATVTEVKSMFCIHSLGYCSSAECLLHTWIFSDFSFRSIELDQFAEIINTQTHTHINMRRLNNITYLCHWQTMKYWRKAENRSHKGRHRLRIKFEEIAIWEQVSKMEKLWIFCLHSSRNRHTFGRNKTQQWLKSHKLWFRSHREWSKKSLEWSALQRVSGEGGRGICNDKALQLKL